MEGAGSWLGPAIVLGLAALGGVTGYVTLRATVAAESKETARRFADSEQDRKDLRNRLEQVDRETVKRDDFNRFDDKIASRFEKIEHAVNNGALKTAQIVKEALRDLLPNRSA